MVAVILCTIKDLDTLPLCITGIRRHCLPRVNDIIVVGQDNPNISYVCEKNGVTYINENSTGITYSDVQSRMSISKEHAGWVYQQILKLQVDKYTCEKDILVIDADKIIIRDLPFIIDGKPVFYLKGNNERKKYMADYLLGFPTIESDTNYINDMMLFSASVLRQLRMRMTMHTGISWDDAIIQMVSNSGNVLDMSEYWLYGYFCDKVLNMPIEMRVGINMQFNVVLTNDIYEDAYNVDTVDLHSPLRMGTYKLC